MKYILTLCALLGVVLLFLLTAASANTALFAGQITLLLGAGIIVVLLLVALVGYQVMDLVNKLKSGVFGAKLTLRLVIFFSLIATVPGVLVYSVSVQFLSKSIESWFNVRVDKALEGGLNLGRTTLDNMLKDLEGRANTMAYTLAEQPDDRNIATFNRLLEQSGARDAALFSENGRIIAFSSLDGKGQMPEFPSAEVLRQIRMQKAYSLIDSDPAEGLILRVVVPVNVLNLHEDIRILQLQQKVPKKLSDDAETVQTIYRDYQGLSFSRLGLKRLYGLTLTLSLLLALLCAVALAFFISEKLSAPLGILAKGTRAVAQGDFSQFHPVQSQDELGILTQSFNLMTHQLAEAKISGEQNQHQLESAKAYLESILINLSSGFLAFDENLLLQSVNPAACLMLDANINELLGIPLGQWATHFAFLSSLTEEIQTAFASGEKSEWKRQIEIPRKNSIQVLLVRGTRLPDVSGKGHIVVFDDITHLLQAQRNAAWGEVARRLAHEIKNPLTPIQLSAERLQHKLTDRLNPQDAEMLKRSTQTIVNQVSSLKNMVDDFSKYAKSSEASLQKTNFNLLIREVLALYESSSLHISVQLAANLPMVNVDANQFRQVLHNLLKNAQDSLGENNDPQIVVKTEISGNLVKFSISDNGCGFPEALMSRVFEPYVTTKQKGTGLGLAIVKKIVEEHNGSIQIENIQPNGACVSIILPAAMEA